VYSLPVVQLRKMTVHKNLEKTFSRISHTAPATYTQSPLTRTDCTIHHARYSEARRTRMAARARHPENEHEKMKAYETNPGSC